MTSQNLLEQTVSFQSNSWSGISQSITVGESLRLIKSGTYRSHIEGLRSYLDLGDQKRYDLEKRRLPAVTFSASFEQKRNSASVLLYNSLLVLDIDKLDRPMLDSLKISFEKDPHIFSFWESPSKAGLKGLICLEYPDGFPINELTVKHTYAFKEVSSYILNNYGAKLDSSGSDVTRLCFFSHDEELFLTGSYEPFRVTYDKNRANLIGEATRTVSYSSLPTMNQKFNPKGKNKQSNRTHMQYIIRFLKKRNLSITSSFYNWHQVAYALANTFTHELGSKYFTILSMMDVSKYKEEQCINMIDYCYANTQGAYTFATVIHFAKQVGYKEEKGVPKVVGTL